jgi:hypothetical protein
MKYLRIFESFNRDHTDSKGAIITSIGDNNYKNIEKCFGIGKYDIEYILSDILDKYPNTNYECLIVNHRLFFIFIYYKETSKCGIVSAFSTFDIDFEEEEFESIKSKFSIYNLKVTYHKPKVGNVYGEFKIEKI